MKILHTLLLGFVALSIALSTTTAYSQFGGIKIPKGSDIKKSVEKELKEESSPSESGSKDDDKSSGSERKPRSRPGVAAIPVGDQPAENLYYNRVVSAFNNFLFEKPDERVLLNKINEDTLMEKFDLKLWNEKYAGKSEVMRLTYNGWKRTIQEMDKLIEGAPQMINSLLDPVSRFAYEHAEQETSPVNKLQWYQKLRKVCACMATLSPDNPTITAKLKEIDRISQSAQKAVSGSTTSSFHAANINKVLFSTKAFEPGSETEATFTTNFTPSDPIFCTIYFDRKISEVQVDWEKFFKIEIYKGTQGYDRVVYEQLVILTPEMYSKTYVQFPIIPDKQWMEKNYSIYTKAENKLYPNILSAFSKLTPITYLMRVGVTFRSPNKYIPQMSGTFNLDCTEGQEKYAQLADKLFAANLADVKIPTATMSNPALENKMLEIMRSKSTVQEYKKAIIVGKDWKIQKNGLGVILYKYIDAVVTSKNNDGKCYYQYFTFKYEYVGGGNYSNTLQLDGVANRTECSCEKIK